MVFFSGHAIGVWYGAEAAEGVSDSSESYLHLAHRSEVTLSDSPNPIAVTKSTSVDKTAFSKGVENPVVNISFTPSQASGKAFIKNFISTDTSFTMLLMIDAGSDTIFARVTGCKVKRMNVGAQIYPSHGPVTVTAEIWGWAIAYTQSAGSPTFEAAPSTIVNYSDVTVKKGGSTITKWWRFEFTLDNELYRQPDNTGATVGIQRGIRNVSGSWQIPAEDVGQTELDEAKNATAVDLNMLLNADDYDFEDCAYTTVSIRHPLTDVVGKQMDFACSVFSIT